MKARGLSVVPAGGQADQVDQAVDRDPLTLDMFGGQDA
jgi:hypothetical protein